MPGSLVGYDDWYETPFLLGGESKAHVAIAREYSVEFEQVPHEDAGCMQVLFRVVSVGERADPALDRRIVQKSCRAQPMRGAMKVPRLRNLEQCLQNAREVLGIAAVTHTYS